MMHDELTALAGAATSPGMENRGAGLAGRRKGRRRAMLAAGAILPATLAGCIQVAAPDKPIVIELNVNIRQEVIYRLAAEAANTVEENKDIF